MKASNQELKELIENILEAYKMEQKEIKLNISSIYINTFIEKTIKEMQPISLEKNIEKTVQIALDSSVNGFIDFLVVAKVDVNPKTDELVSADWEVINVATAKTIGSGSMVAPKPYREKEVSIQRFGVDVGSEIYSCIKGN